MDHVSRHQYRNAQTAFLYCSPLHGIDFCGIHTIQYGSDFAFCRLIRKPCPAGKLVHLTYFLMQGHLAQKFLNLSVSLCLRS